jgi:hypothetical protein
MTLVLLFSNYNENYVASASLLDFNLAAAGDWNYADIATHTEDNISAKDPELVIGLGDFSYRDKADCWLEKIAPLDDKMKITIGNHDDETSSLLKQYMNHFNLTRQFYSFNYENVHFSVISTELGHGVGTEQYEFVNADLATAASDPNIDWIVVYYHKLAYTSPGHHVALDPLRDTYHPLFEKYDVDLVLQAHNHYYERSYPIKYNNANPYDPIIADANNNNNTYSNPDGQIFVTVGTGGQRIHPLSTKESYMVTDYKGHGFLNIDVIDNGQTFNATFYSNYEDFTDQFSITKNISNSADI